MSLRLRDLVIAVFGFALAALMLFVGAIAGDILPGLFLLAVSTLWLLGRARVPEAGGVAGRFALRRARLGIARVVVMLAVYIGICVAMYVGWRDDWNDTTEGRVAFYALAGLAYLLLKRSTVQATTQLDGGAEDAPRSTCGASSSRCGIQAGSCSTTWRKTGAATSTTSSADPAAPTPSRRKSGATVRRDDLRSARINAAWMKPRLGVRWVTPVLCLVGSDAKPYEHEGLSCSASATSTVGSRAGREAADRLAGRAGAGSSELTCCDAGRRANRARDRR